MNEIHEAKTLTRNSMLDKLKSKIATKKIAVEAVSYDEEDDFDAGETAPFSIERALAMESKKETQKDDVLDSYLKVNPLFAVAELDNGLFGGTLDAVMTEIQTSGTKTVAFKIVTTDENAAKAFFEEEEVVAPMTEEVVADTDTDAKLLTMLTAIKNHAESAESEISSGMFIAREYDKFLADNGIEDLGLAIPGNKLHEMAEQVKNFANATKESAEIILNVV